MSVEYVRERRNKKENDRENLTADDEYLVSHWRQQCYDEQRYDDDACECQIIRKIHGYFEFRAKRGV